MASNVRRPTMTSVGVGQDDDLSAISRSALLAKLVHATSCLDFEEQARNRHGPALEPCAVPHCDFVKDLYLHTLNCATVMCSKLFCDAAKSVMNHWISCMEYNCYMCTWATRDNMLNGVQRSQEPLDGAYDSHFGQPSICNHCGDPFICRYYGRRVSAIEPSTPGGFCLRPQGGWKPGSLDREMFLRSREVDAAVSRPRGLARRHRSRETLPFPTLSFNRRRETPRSTTAVLREVIGGHQGQSPLVPRASDARRNFEAEA